MEKYYRERGVENIVWTNCKKRGAKALNELQKVMIACLQNEHRFNRTVKNEYQVGGEILIAYLKYAIFTMTNMQFQFYEQQYFKINFKRKFR